MIISSGHNSPFSNVSLSTALTVTLKALYSPALMMSFDIFINDTLKLP